MSYSVKNIKGIAEALRRNFFAGYLTANLAFATVLCSGVLFLVTLFGGLPREGLLIVSLGLVVAVAMLWIARLRLSARLIPVRIGAVPIFFGLLYVLIFGLGMSIAFIEYDTLDHPVKDARIFLFLVVMPFFLYYTGKVLLATISVWWTPYKELATLYRASPAAVPRLINLLPAYAKGQARWKLALGFVAIGVTVSLVSFLIMGVFFLAWINFSVVVEDAGNFTFKSSDMTERQYLLVANSPDLKHQMTTLYMGQSLFVVLLLPIMVILTYPLRYLAMRLFRRDVASMLEADGRKPVVYLRAFGDDKLRMKGKFFSISKFITQSYRIKRLDEMLSEGAWHVGPIIALQDPQGRLVNTKGPAVEKLPHDDWQDRVAAHIQEARLIVLQLNLTDGLMWEFEQCLSPDTLKKTIFVFGTQEKVKRASIAKHFLDKLDIHLQDDSERASLLMGMMTENGFELTKSNRRSKFDYMASLLYLLDRSSVTRSI